MNAVPQPLPLPLYLRSSCPTFYSVAGITALISSTPALAETAAPPGLPSGAVLQAFIGLVIVLGLIAAIAFLMRRLPASRAFAQGTMKIVGGIAIGPRERVVLLEVADTWVLIGIAPGQLRTLHTLAKGEAPSTAEATPAPFSQWLQHFTEQRKKK